MEKFYVYILSNQQGFTKKYNVHKLLYYEEFSNADDAKHREKQIKKYKREWKENLVNSKNSTWNDLYDDFMLNK